MATAACDARRSDLAVTRGLDGAGPVGVDHVVTAAAMRPPLPLWIRPMTALVVDPDPLRRARSRRELEHEGYAIVMSCAGPDVVHCPVATALVPSPCTLVDPGIGCVVLAPRYVPRLRTWYRQWLPDAEVRVAGAGTWTDSPLPT